MQAAVVREFGQPPRYEQFTLPTPVDGEQLVDVVAAGLHPRVRSQAAGSHYTSTDALPLIPGIDGVGRRADGSLIYFLLPDTAYGSMAEQTIVEVRRSVPVPDGVDPIAVAAAMNPAMASWVALTARVTFEPGQSVLVLGATGSAGRLAVQVARHLGAGSIVAAGRGADRLARLGADAAVDLAGHPDSVAAALSSAAANVDVVLDFLWGPPTEAAIMPVLQGRHDRSRLLCWIEIGAVAGGSIALPSAALRQANVHFLGSGQGSASAAGILASLPSLIEQIGLGTFETDAVARPLADVESLWADSAAGDRIVLTP